MQIEILFWGDMPRLAGTDRQTLDIPNPATVADAVQKLAADPAVAGELSRCIYSINGTFVGASFELHEGDKLSVDLPPAS